MSTVAKRLAEAHETLLKLYSSIPVLSPCLEKIKINHAEFIALNSRLRQLQDIIATGQYKSDKIRKQLDSVFTLNKVECERAYHQEINQLKAYEDERRACLRKRDDVVTLKYKLQKERAVLLEATRQLKRVNESVFDRSKDTVANTDFPEELYWQLELKEYDAKIDTLKRQLTKYNTALTCLARAANLSEAALMAFLGFPDAAYKVWRVEYALKATQRMRLYLRVELSLTNAYTNEDSAREACPNIMPSLAKPIKVSSVQGYFGTSALEPTASTSKKNHRVVAFNGEAPLRAYIAHLRSAHKTAELLVAQETERMNAMQANRESIIPMIARIRRHVFQNSCLGGFQIEGWENELGQPLLGSEADYLVRGGIQEVEPESASRPGPPTHSHPIQSTIRVGVDEEEITALGERRGSGSDQARVPDTEERETAIDHNNPLIVHDGRVTLSAGRAPLSTLAPGNMLGSEVLMQVDRQRRQSEAQVQSRTRSKSRTRRSSEGGPSNSESPHGLSALGNLILNNTTADINGDSGTSSSAPSTQTEREGRKKSRGLFGFARSRRGSNTGGDDAVVPSVSTNHSSIFSLTGRRNRISADMSSLPMERSVTVATVPGDNTQTTSNEVAQIGHRRNVPSISISNQDGVTSEVEHPHPLRRTFFENASLGNLPTGRPRVVSMDEYIGVGPVQRPGEYHHSSSEFDLVLGSAPLIPSYEEHEQHQVVDPESVQMITNSGPFESGLSSLAEHDEADNARDIQGGGTSAQGQNDVYLPNYYNGGRRYASSRVRSRSLSPHPVPTPFESMTLVNVGNSTGRTDRTYYQGHNYSLSEQPTCATQGEVPPPDYIVRPPEYTA
ncbi:hypothetical protein BGZ93_002301 [Podila epicladia]|nr:hypothetical protein BGZ92_007244 [Podila epicladia]KAG0097637.1 hypothetical protein BGZ93_002301 [Podila epicladia]